MRRLLVVAVILLLWPFVASAQTLADDSLRVREDSVLAASRAIVAQDSSALDEFERLIGIYKGRRRFTAQLEAATAMVRANRRSPLANLLLGDALLDNGDPETALTYLTRAIELERSYVRARVMLAETYDFLGYQDSALLQLDTALLQNPRHAQAHMQKAKLLTLARRDAEAVQHLRAACELLPDDRSAVGPWLRLADALVRTYAYDEAADAYRYCLRLQPESADAQMKLAETLEAAGRKEEAVRAFTDFCYLFPTDPRALDAERAVMRLGGRVAP